MLPDRRGGPRCSDFCDQAASAWRASLKFRMIRASWRRGIHLPALVHAAHRARRPVPDRGPGGADTVVRPPRPAHCATPRASGCYPSLDHRVAPTARRRSVRSVEPVRPERLLPVARCRLRQASPHQLLKSSVASDTAISCAHASLDNALEWLRRASPLAQDCIPAPPSRWPAGRNRRSRGHRVPAGGP